MKPDGMLPAVDQGEPRASGDRKGSNVHRPREPRRRHCRVIAWFVAVFAATSFAVQPVSGALSTGCTVPPRPASEFVLPSDPALAGEYWLMVEDEAQLPAGTRATAADEAAAQAFAELYTACQNAGDLRRITALYSDAMFQGSLAARISFPAPSANPLAELLAVLFDPTARFAAEAAAELAQDVSAPPVPLSPPIAAAEARDVRVLPDGRLGAILVQDSRPTEFQIYVRVDGRLLLDERMDLRLDDFERPAGA